MPDPNRRAVALRYNAATDAAPVVVAKGRGAVADRIVAVARANGVAIHDNPALAAVLGRLNLDQHIPPQLYAAVAAILAVLHKANRANAV